MSAEDTREFFARLETDASLQERARAVQSGPEDERVAGLVRLAAEQGLVVTPEDLGAEARPGAGPLDDEALRPVVGGLGCPPRDDPQSYQIPLG